MNKDHPASFVLAFDSLEWHVELIQILMADDGRVDPFSQWILSINGLTKQRRLIGVSVSSTRPKDKCICFL